VTGNIFLIFSRSNAVKLPQIPHLFDHPSSKQKPLIGQAKQMRTAISIKSGLSSGQNHKSGSWSKQEACCCQSSGFGQMAQTEEPCMGS
jgi:hypothetical protein